MAERDTRSINDKIASEVQDQISKMKKNSGDYREIMLKTNRDPNNQQYKHAAQEWNDYYKKLEEYMVQERLEKLTNQQRTTSSQSTTRQGQYDRPDPRSKYYPPNYRSKHRHKRTPPESKPPSSSSPPPAASIPNIDDNHIPDFAGSFAPDVVPNPGPPFHPVWDTLWITANVLYALRKPLLATAAVLAVGYLCKSGYDAAQNWATSVSQSMFPTPIVETYTPPTNCQHDGFEVYVTENARNDLHHTYIPGYPQKDCMPLIEVSGCITASKGVTPDTISAPYNDYISTPYVPGSPNAEWLVQFTNGSKKTVQVCKAHLNQRGVEFLRNGQ